MISQFSNINALIKQRNATVKSCIVVSNNTGNFFANRSVKIIWKAKPNVQSKT